MSRNLRNATLVILPAVAGLATAYIGLDNLQTRLGNAIHNARVESSLQQVQESIGDLSRDEQILRRYEKSLQAFEFKDATLTAVLAQYASQRRAAEQIPFLSGRSASHEVDGLAEDVLNILQNDVMPIKVDENLPGTPLII